MVKTMGSIYLDENAIKILQDKKEKLKEQGIDADYSEVIRMVIKDGK